MAKQKLICPVKFEDDLALFKASFINVDNWHATNPSDKLFTSVVGAVISNVSGYFGSDNRDLDYFIVSPKKCYNSLVMRDHMTTYLNYFEKYYDSDKEFLIILYQLKYLIDTQETYQPNDLFRDIKRYITSPTIIEKARKMVEDNYILDLNYKSISNPSLQYTNRDAKLLLVVSILMNMMIPLVCHYAYTRRIENIDEFLLQAFDIPITEFTYEVDIYNKLYETCHTNVAKSEQTDAGIWRMQDIRSKNVTTHTLTSVYNIILNIMPKYCFNANIVSMNFSSIQNSLQYTIIGIQFEFQYAMISSVKDSNAGSDDGATSAMDRYEAALIKQNEATLLQSQWNCYETMKTIRQMYGPFDPKEIEYYRKKFSEEKDSGMNEFRMNLIFLLHYKYFRDSESIKAIDSTNFIELILASKKILQMNYLKVMPYIISGKIVSLSGRKSINKKELARIEASPQYKLVEKKYLNDKIIKIILGYLATILSSTFEIIDYYDRDLDGKKIKVEADLIVEEFLSFCLLA